MSQTNVSITAQPVSAMQCKFTVSEPLYAEQSFYFGSKESAEGSPLAERLFAIEGVKAVLLSHNVATVTKSGAREWPIVGKEIGAALRAHLASGQPAVSEEVRNRLPGAEVLRDRVQRVLETEINPSVAAHGGVVRLVDVKDNVVFIQMGGGCQGCASSQATLRYGVENAIRQAVPEIGDILDVTDHAAGQNPYYAR